MSQSHRSDKEPGSCSAPPSTQLWQASQSPSQITQANHTGVASKPVPITWPNHTGKERGATPHPKPSQQSKGPGGDLPRLSTPPPPCQRVNPRSTSAYQSKHTTETALQKWQPELRFRASQGPAGVHVSQSNCINNKPPAYSTLRQHWKLHRVLSRHTSHTHTTTQQPQRSCVIAIETPTTNLTRSRCVTPRQHPVANNILYSPRLHHKARHTNAHDSPDNSFSETIYMCG